MADRPNLQTMLETLLESRNVYNQPPASLKLKYPCIIFELADIDAKFADNHPYKLDKKYSVTYICYEPDDPFIDILASLPKCKFDRPFVSDNLYHFVFELFY